MQECISKERSLEGENSEVDQSSSAGIFNYIVAVHVGAIIDNYLYYTIHFVIL